MKKSTKNYSQFKIHECNTVYDQNAYRKLIASLKAKNLLEFEPIKVDAQMRVIDGKHRLKAAEELQIPIWYEQNLDAIDEDFLLFNTAKRTAKLDDFLEFFIYKGNINYVKFKRFCEKNKMTFRTAFCFFHNCSRGRAYESWKKGEFKFPNTDEIEEIEKILIEVNEIILYIKEKMRGSHNEKNWLKSDRMKASLQNFLKISEVQSDVFKKKLSFQIDKIHPCANYFQYLQMWKKIYNWKNSNPLEHVPD
jgi:hypothetical protein